MISKILRHAVGGALLFIHIVSNARYAVESDLSTDAEGKVQETEQKHNPLCLWSCYKPCLSQQL